MGKAKEEVPTMGTGILQVESVQELVQKDSFQVPERYIRDDEERPNDTHVSSLETPVIDLSLLSCGNEEEVKKLERACREWGFFQMINHGLADDLIQKTKAAIADFFKLPLEEKQKYSMELHDMQGYGHFVVSEDQKLEWGDLLGFSVYPIKHRNLNAWPTTPPEFRDVIEQYSAEVNRVGKELLGNISLMMKMDKSSLEELHGELMQIIRNNYYPICPRPDLVLGLSPHSDSNSITILLQDEVTGLQIRHDGGWVPITPMPNALLVNIGDCIEMWSNGKYKSIEHRVVTNKHKPRISVASFIEPAMDAYIEPLDQMVDCEQLRVYRKIKYGDYFRNYLEKRLEGKTHTQFGKLENE
ncbi:protein SRG1 [Cinnamomum micranthum f. kanehirae]|uniref:Protein SRG1 n=1 Tax=Cinnamomum micranthum f. kanehirae TaxID=337451 RepID=A0A3S3MTT4_9MAGN|nr:protein SRG1 [Cinnamomum micranthum f. kanehirae]